MVKTKWTRNASRRVVREEETEPPQFPEVESQLPQPEEVAQEETLETQPPQPPVVEENVNPTEEEVGSSESDEGEELGSGTEGEQIGSEEENGEEEEQEEGEEEVKEGEDNERSDSMEESMVEAIAPMSMYFPPSEYTKKIKISTRCFVSECLHTLNNLKPELDYMERRWFENHPQFRHFFHMPKDSNHKLMGMWMVLLRTARIEREKKAWFVINGVPVRYGIREHALMSGINCENYPLAFKEKGSLRFVNKYFGVGATVRYQDIKDKLEEMEPSFDRLKMAVLYFLSSIIISPTKAGEKALSVEPFFLRVVDDLKLCKIFPWERLSFDHMLREISRTIEHFRGVVKESKTWVIPGFCLLLEWLAFESIPHLWMKFREPFIGAKESCPCMCKSHFKKSEMKGFPLSRINK